MAFERYRYRALKLGARATSQIGTCGGHAKAYSRAADVGRRAPMGIRDPWVLDPPAPTRRRPP